MTPRETIPRPIFRKDLEISRLERQISSNVDRLAALQANSNGTAPRFTFFINQLTNGLRRRGHLLPGDGKGGLIKPKGSRP